MTRMGGKIIRAMLLDERGITGLETAIVLIAFVVVSSVFAFAALSTGLFTTDKAKQTIHAGLDETSGTIELNSSVTVTAAVTGSAGYVSEVTFWVANAAGGRDTDMEVGNTVIKYSDPTQSKIFDGSPGASFTATGIGSADSDSFLELGEVFEIKLSGIENGGTNGLDNNLGPNTSFTLEIVPPLGALLYIERTTPPSLNATENLD